MIYMYTNLHINNIINGYQKVNSVGGGKTHHQNREASRIYKYRLRPLNTFGIFTVPSKEKEGETSEKTETYIKSSHTKHFNFTV